MESLAKSDSVDTATDSPLNLWEKILGCIALFSPFIGIAIVAVLLSGCQTTVAEDETAVNYEGGFPTIDQWWK